MSGFDYAQQERRIASLESNRGASLRFGTVTGVDTATGTARVELPDGDGMVTMPLRVLGRRTLKDKAQALPDIGEPVACLFSGQGLEQGVILGAHYTAKTPSPNQEAQVDYVRYEDGTELWYDRKGHKLTAKVMGDADIETEGGITATAKKAIVTESKTGITLRAPHIRLEGNLSQQGYAGGAASSILCGKQTICNGSLSVPGGDVSAGDVSLRGHQHEGVESGPDTSGKPEGGGSGGTNEDSNNSNFWEILFGLISNMLPDTLTPKEELLLCLHRIAEVIAERSLLPKDKQGWLYLRDMFQRWFSGQGNDNAEKNPDPLIQPEYLFSPKGRAALTENLRRDEFLANERKPFFYTEQHWSYWQKGYFQQIVVPGFASIDADGLMAAMGSFTLRALATGFTQPNGEGGHTMVIQKVKVVVWDSFNFDGKYDLRYWKCSPESFSFNEDDGYSNVENKDFQNFREKYGYGNDFMVLSHPYEVEYFKIMSYDTEL